MVHQVRLLQRSIRGPAVVRPRWPRLREDPRGPRAGAEVPDTPPVPVRRRRADDRSEILQAFEVGRVNLLCNASLLTEGFDCPAVSCIVPLRPTRSAGLYQQMIGRGTRLSPGKQDCLVLDFLWASD